MIVADSLTFVFLIIIILLITYYRHVRLVNTKNYIDNNDNNNNHDTSINKKEQQKNDKIRTEVYKQMQKDVSKQRLDYITSTTAIPTLSTCTTIPASPPVAIRPKTRASSQNFSRPTSASATSKSSSIAAITTSNRPFGQSICHPANYSLTDIAPNNTNNTHIRSVRPTPQHFHHAYPERSDRPRSAPAGGSRQHGRGNNHNSNNNINDNDSSSNNNRDYSYDENSSYDHFNNNDSTNDQRHEYNDMDRSRRNNRGSSSGRTGQTNRSHSADRANRSSGTEGGDNRSGLTDRPRSLSVDRSSRSQPRSQAVQVSCDV